MRFFFKKIICRISESKTEDKIVKKKKRKKKVDIAAQQHVNLLSIRELFLPLFYYCIFLETESVSEVSGPHDMEAIEKKSII